MLELASIGVISDLYGSIKSLVRDLPRDTQLWNKFFPEKKEAEEKTERFRSARRIVELGKEDAKRGKAARSRISLATIRRNAGYKFSSRYPDDSTRYSKLDIGYRCFETFSSGDLESILEREGLDRSLAREDRPGDTRHPRIRVIKLLRFSRRKFYPRGC